jgi:hypothetical protein
LEYNVIMGRFWMVTNVTIFGFFEF